jgi:hypothetical protein
MKEKKVNDPHDHASCSFLLGVILSDLLRKKGLDRVTGLKRVGITAGFRKKLA